MNQKKARQIVTYVAVATMVVCTLIAVIASGAVALEKEGMGPDFRVSLAAQAVCDQGVAGVSAAYDVIVSGDNAPELEVYLEVGGMPLSYMEDEDKYFIFFKRHVLPAGVATIHYRESNAGVWSQYSAPYDGIDCTQPHGVEIDLQVSAYSECVGDKVTVTAVYSIGAGGRMPDFVVTASVGQSHPMTEVEDGKFYYVFDGSDILPGRVNFYYGFGENLEWKDTGFEAQNCTEQPPATVPETPDCGVQATKNIDGISLSVEFTVPEDCQHEMTLAAHPCTVVSCRPYSTQAAPVYATDTFGPGRHLMVVELPCGHSQWELVYGQAISDLTQELYGDRKVIHGFYTRTEGCDEPPTTTVPPTTVAPTTTAPPTPTTPAPPETTIPVATTVPETTVPSTTVEVTTTTTPEVSSTTVTPTTEAPSPSHGMTELPRTGPDEEREHFWLMVGIGAIVGALIGVAMLVWQWRHPSQPKMGE